MNQEIHDLAQEYAVGAMSDDETTEFAAHLEGCDACRLEVAALVDVTAALSDGVATEPPPELRAAVLAAVARTPQESGVTPEAPGRVELVGAPQAKFARGETPSDDRAGASAQDPTVVPLRRRSWTTAASSLVAAAAVLAAVAFGGLWIQTRDDVDQATAQADQLTALLSADDVTTVQGVSHSADHTGAIVMSRSEGQAIFVASELPDLSGDQVYEAWTIDGAAAPQPAGTFTPHTTHSVLTLPAASLRADSMAITVEPAGGSQQPTSDAVVTFVMPQA